MITHFILIILVLFYGVIGSILYKYLGKGGIGDKIFNFLLVIIWGGVYIYLPMSPQPRLEINFALFLQIIGAILVLGFFIIGRFALKERKAWGYQKSKLCTQGIYNIIRHPIYIAWFIFYVGWSLIWKAVYSLYFIPVMFLLIYLECCIEEQYMVGKEFPEEYKNYRKKVGMFFPRFSAICQICPLCVAARNFPESGFAKKIKSLQIICPFCKAYKSEKEGR